MEPDIDTLLDIPDFLKRTPEQTQAIIEQNRRLDQEEQKRVAERRAAFERAQAAAKAERERRTAERAERRKLREARDARREAKQAAYDRILGLGSTPFTIGRLEKKLGLDRKVALAAIRRGRKAGYIRKVSRRRYRGA